MFAWERNGFALKSKNSNVLWIKLTYPVAVLSSLLFVCSSGRFNAISAIYRYLGGTLYWTVARVTKVVKIHLHRSGHANEQ